MSHSLPDFSSCPVVAIIGRPNVGKSTFFNRLIGYRKAIVDDQAGITRDRNYDTTIWNGREMIIVDTGGFICSPEGEMEEHIVDNIKIALEEADLTILLLDGREELTRTDYAIIKLLRHSGKRWLVAVNKLDNLEQQQMLNDFYRLGVDKIWPISAIQGIGIGDMLDEVVKLLPQPTVENNELANEEELIKVCIIGRPNVGKSTLFNQMIGNNRSLVTSIPGTTRDPVDTLVEKEDKKYLLVDTAGIRRKSKIIPGVEKYSFLRAYRSLERADIALCLIDALEGPTESEARVFSLVEQKARGAILLVNKWDALEKDDKTIYRFTERVREIFTFFSHIPIIFISALTGQRVNNIWDMINKVYQNYNRRIPTAELNKYLSPFIEANPPPMARGHRPNILYATQPQTQPPTFIFFAHEPETIKKPYRRYLANCLYKGYDFEGTPVIIHIRSGRKNKNVR